MNCVRTRGEEPPRLYGVINGLLRMRNGLRRSQELDDLVDVLASSIGALTNPRTNCPHRRRSRRRSLAARDRRQLPEDRPRTRRGQTRPRRARHPHDERLRFPPRLGQPDDVTPDGRQMPRNADPPHRGLASSTGLPCGTSLARQQMRDPHEPVKRDAIPRRTHTTTITQNLNRVNTP